MACLHEAIVAAIGRAADRSDRSHVCLHGAIVAAIGRATDRCERDRLHVCLHGAIVAAIGRAFDRRDRSGDRSPRPMATTIAPCKHRLHAIVAAISLRDHRVVLM